MVQKRETWNLWIDDMRDPEVFLRVRVVDYDGYKYETMTFPEFEVYIRKEFKAEDFVWCKNAEQAIAEVEDRGVPKFMALDHDLGTHDVFQFLKWLSENHPESPPDWYAHSANSCGRENIDSFMRSWHKVHAKE